MDSNSFQFVLTMPGDARLVGAVRDLTAQAASYARLSSEIGQLLAQHVVDATQTVIEGTHSNDAPVEFRFDRNGAAIRITISSEAAPDAARPSSTSSGGLSIRWSREGSRQICEIQQHLSS